MTSLEAYFCKTEDLVDFGFALAEKRDVLQPLECHMNIEVTLKNDFPVRMINTSHMTLELGEAILKLSIDDLYTFKTISDKQN